MGDDKVNETIRQRIDQLMTQVQERVPMTRRVLAHLSEIEDALNAGVRRADLAEAMNMRPDQFNAALAGARRLDRQGGDGRRMRQGKKKNRTSLSSRPSPKPSAAGRPGDLLKPFGGNHE